MKKAKILFACIEQDGHFNPLTGLATHLQTQGYDVAWYTGAKYGLKLQHLGIRHFPFTKALDTSLSTIDQLYPELLRMRSTIQKFRYGIKHHFILRAPDFLEDIQALYADFPFDLLIADSTFTGMPFVRELMNKPAIAVGIVPLTETSKDVRPYGLGLHPAKTYPGKVIQAFQRYLANKLIFEESKRIINQLFIRYGLQQTDDTIFDVVCKRADLFLQSGTPGFEYYRSDLGQNIRFIGPLLPEARKANLPAALSQKLKFFKKVILVTQGTVEGDIKKLLIPTLEALRQSDHLVIATTGGSMTTELRGLFPEQHFHIADFIPFDAILPHTDLYITNGGYGGVLMAINHGVPMVVAGKNEGKIEINARVSYFGLGVDLKTETPRVPQLRTAIRQVLEDSQYRSRTQRLAQEFANYNPAVLCERYVAEILQNEASILSENRYHSPHKMEFAT